MKTILEFKETEMKKTAANLNVLSIPAMTLIPSAASIMAGKLYSDVTAPPAGKHETFQTNLLKKELKDVLTEREKKKRLDKLKEVLNGSKRSIRL